MKFRKKEGASISRREGDKTFVFHQSRGWVCILNPTATFLWEHCTGDLTAEEMADLLADRFEIPEAYADPSQLLNLVTEHLRLLQQGDLLESTAESTAA